MPIRRGLAKSWELLSIVQTHPCRARFRLRKRVFRRSEDVMRVTVERKPTAHVLRIPAIFLETERAVGAHEDIDTVVA